MTYECPVAAPAPSTAAGRRLLSKLLDETSARDEIGRTRMPGSAMLEVWSLSPAI
jgi:hypothetical protein